MSADPFTGAPGVPFIGVVSDTHGFYDAALDDVFAGAAHIVHAGDFGTLDVLTRLQSIAPLTVVAGNVDVPTWSDQIPWEAQAEVLGLRVLVGHVGAGLMGAHDPVAEGFDLVVSGHSHRAAVEWRGQTLFLNPGSAGRPRFGQARTCAVVDVRDGRPEPHIVTLG
jgi:uncharacterized protein